MRPIAPRSHVRTIAALLAACAAGTAAVVAVAPAASASPIIYPAALTDSFYASPDDLADHRPGDVLAARPVSAPAGFLNTEAVQLKFRSTNSEGHPIAAVTTVLSPRGAAPGRGVVVVSAHHQCSGARLCAVDRDVHRRSEAGDPRSPWPERRHREGIIPIFHPVNPWRPDLIAIYIPIPKSEHLVMPLGSRP